jgi:hypothetical protein
MVECKAPHVPLDVNVLQQISQYQSKLRSNFWAITNGINHKIFEIDTKENQIKNINSFPIFL